MHTSTRFVFPLVALGVASACSEKPAPVADAPKPAAVVAEVKAPTPEEANAFVKKVDADLRKLWVRQATAQWVKSTYITMDTEANEASMNEDVMAYLT
jgi:peptidyl-dipeptidase A